MREIIIKNQGDLTKEDLKHFYNQCQLEISTPLGLVPFIEYKEIGLDVKFTMYLKNDKTDMRILVEKYDDILEDFINKSKFTHEVSVITLSYLVAMGFGIENEYFDDFDKLIARAYTESVFKYIDFDKSLAELSNIIMNSKVNLPFEFSGPRSLYDNVKEILEEEHPEVLDMSGPRVLRWLKEYVKNNDKELDNNDLGLYSSIISTYEHLRKFSRIKKIKYDVRQVLNKNGITPISEESLRLLYFKDIEDDSHLVSFKLRELDVTDSEISANGELRYLVLKSIARGISDSNEITLFYSGAKNLVFKVNGNEFESSFISNLMKPFIELIDPNLIDRIDICRNLKECLE